MSIVFRPVFRRSIYKYNKQDLDREGPFLPGYHPQGRPGHGKAAAI